MRKTTLFCFVLAACGGDKGDSDAPSDRDGDGIIDVLDCDADDPMAADLDEICDQIDNNCNGSVDEGLMQLWYADYDHDGYGDPAHSFARCIKQPGFVLNDDDCDDDDDEVGPCKD
jgi:hypothetical protein